MTYRNTLGPASPRQYEWIDKKLAEHGLSREDMAQRTGHAYDDLTGGRQGTASVWLDLLFNLPRPVAAGAVEAPGLYLNADGQVAKVQRTQDGLRLYAKVLVPGSGFVYRSNAIREFKATDAVTPEQARQYGIHHGVCINCGADLDDPLSAAVGLGTTCGPKILGKDGYGSAKRDALAVPTVAAAVKAHKAALKARADVRLAATAAVPTGVIAPTPDPRGLVLATATPTVSRSTETGNYDADLLAEFGV